MGYWGKGAKRAYHHTAPVNTLYGLHESLVMLLKKDLKILGLDIMKTTYYLKTV